MTVPWGREGRGHNCRGGEERREGQFLQEKGGKTKMGCYCRGEERRERLERFLPRRVGKTVSGNESCFVIKMS